MPNSSDAASSSLPPPMTDLTRTPMQILLAVRPQDVVGYSYLPYSTRLVSRLLQETADEQPRGRSQGLSGLSSLPRAGSPQLPQGRPARNRRAVLCRTPAKRGTIASPAREKTDANRRSSSCGCAAGRAISTCGTPSPMPPSNIAASSASCRPACRASCCPTCCRCPARSWTSGRSSAACITTTRAIPPATRSASRAIPPGPNPDENTYPSCGSIVSRQLGHQTPHLPAYVMIPRMVPGTGSGYLGVAHKPFETLADPAAPGRSACRTSPCPPASRWNGSAIAGILLKGFDDLRRDADASGQVEATRPLRPAGVGHPDVEGGPRCLRPRPGTGQAPRALRLHAGVRSQGGQSLRRTRLEPAHSAGAPAGRGRRPPGDRRSALVGHARAGLRFASPGLLAALRPGLFRPHRRPRRSRPAGIDAGHRLGRVRPNADESTTTRAAIIIRTSSAPRWRAARSRAAGWSASPTPRALFPSRQPEDAAGRARDDVPAPRRRRHRAVSNDAGRPITVLPSGKPIEELG